jgi:hypothetical protein
MLGDIEDVKREIKKLIVAASFADACAAVDAEKNAVDQRTVVTTAPEPASVWTTSRRAKQNWTFPICEVLGHTTVYDQNSSRAKGMTHTVGINWTQVGDDEETITTQLERLVRATRDTFWPDGSEGIHLQAVMSAPVQLLSEEYAPLLPSNQSGAFVKGSITMLRVQTFG